MNLSVLPAVFAFNISLLLSLILFLIYNMEKSSKDAKYLSMLCFSTAIYVFGQIMLNNNENVGRAIFWHKFQHIGIIVIVPAWLNFVFNYIEKKKNLFVKILNLISVLMLVLLYATPFVISDTPYKYAGRFIQGKEGFLYYFLLLMLISSLLYGYFLLIKRYFTNISSRSYELIMLLGIGAAIIFGINDMLTIINEGDGTTLFEYGLTIMCISLMYSWVIGKGFYEKNLLRNVFNRYISYPIIKKNGMILNTEKGAEIDVSVVFADIRDFTSLSEKLGPSGVVSVLNKFMNSMAEVAELHSGVIDKLMGDNVMVIFGVIGKNNDHPGSAVKASLMMIDRSKDILTEEMKVINRTVKIGIGINTGKVVIGNIGSEKRMAYTVIGDTVNVAARLQEEAEAGKIFVTGKVLETLKDMVHYEEVGLKELKGKSEPVMVYNVTGLKGRSGE